MNATLRAPLALLPFECVETYGLLCLFHKAHAYCVQYACTSMDSFVLCVVFVIMNGRDCAAFMGLSKMVEFHIDCACII